jgi:hypothetical protein
MWTIWEDPAKVSVADTRTSVRSFVKKKSIERSECRFHLDPLHQTGWQEDRNYRDFDCDWSKKKASVVADAHFFNDDFLGVICSARDRTHIYVSRNKVTVNLKESDGTVLHTWSRGGCHQLLGWGTLFEPNTFYNN